MKTHDASGNPQVAQTRARRWLLVSGGVASVLLAALGVIVPGLPTTIFLIIASWCFTRSCPWLEDRLLRNRLFRPFLPYLEPGATMPRRARVAATVLMWAAIVSSGLLISRVWVGAVLFAAGGLGTWGVWRMATPRSDAGARSGP